MCVPGCQESVRHTLSRRGLLQGAAIAALAGSASVPAAVPAAAFTAPVGQFTGVVDLTHVMSGEFPTFFGVPGLALEKKFDFARDGFNLNWWHIIEHAGTHLDAPIHFSADGRSADQIPADALVVPLVVLDAAATAVANPDYLVSRNDLLAWEQKHGRLPENCCVAMHSGWGAHVADPGRFTGKDAAGVFHFPGFGLDAAEWLLAERNVAGLAVDTLSLDHGPSKDFKVHHAWLPSGRWGLENVAGLDQVPASGATLVVGLPRVKGATGGPVRLLALV
jgi:kynurenine formamidase